MGFILGLMLGIPFGVYYGEKKLRFPITYISREKEFGMINLDLYGMSSVIKDLDAKFGWK